MFDPMDGWLNCSWNPAYNFSTCNHKIQSPAIPAFAFYSSYKNLRRNMRSLFSGDSSQTGRNYYYQQYQDLLRYFLRMKTLNFHVNFRNFF